MSWYLELPLETRVNILMFATQDEAAVINLNRPRPKRFPIIYEKSHPLVHVLSFRPRTNILAFLATSKQTHDDMLIALLKHDVYELLQKLTESYSKPASVCGLEPLRFVPRNARYLHIHFNYLLEVCSPGLNPLVTSRFEELKSLMIHGKDFLGYFSFISTSASLKQWRVPTATTSKVVNALRAIEVWYICADGGQARCAHRLEGIDGVLTLSHTREDLLCRGGTSRDWCLVDQKKRKTYESMLGTGYPQH